MKASEIKPGMRFGRLLVLSLARKDMPSGGSKLYANCQCDCGNEKQTQASSLAFGHSNSCGCLRSELTATRTAAMARKRAENRNLSCVGKKFNHLTVTKAYRCESVLHHPWRFEAICDCGQTTDVQATAVIHGHTKGCKRCQGQRSAAIRGYPMGAVIAVQEGESGRMRIVKKQKIPVSEAIALGIGHAITVNGAWVRCKSVEDADKWLWKPHSQQAQKCCGCGQEFLTTKTRKKFCSVSCYRANKRMLDWPLIARLRATGMTWPEIGKFLNCSATGASNGYRSWQKQQQKSQVQS